MAGLSIRASTLICRSSGGSFWLEDPAEELKTYFAGEFCDAFTGIAKLSIENSSTLTIYDDYYVHIIVLLHEVK